jgi:hypothetical protein
MAIRRRIDDGEENGDLAFGFGLAGGGDQRFRKGKGEGAASG